jgi:hypothetical protein
MKLIDLLLIKKKKNINFIDGNARRLLADYGLKENIIICYYSIGNDMFVLFKGKKKAHSFLLSFNPLVKGGFYLSSIKPWQFIRFKSLFKIKEKQLKIVDLNEWNRIIEKEFADSL